MANLDGGAAFPRAGYGFAHGESPLKHDCEPQDGVTLRQYYFARLVPEMLRAGVHQRGVCEAAWKLAGEMVETSK